MVGALRTLAVIERSTAAQHQCLARFSDVWRNIRSGALRPSTCTSRTTCACWSRVVRDYICIVCVLVSNIVRMDVRTNVRVDVRMDARVDVRVNVRVDVRMDVRMDVRTDVLEYMNNNIRTDIPEYIGRSCL